MKPNYEARVACVMSTSVKAALAACLFIGAMAVPVTSPRADETTSLEGEIANVRLVSEISDALSAYTRAVDALAQTVDAQRRAEIETVSFDGYRRVVWLVSELQSSATEAEADEFASVQEMIGVYHEIDGNVAAAAKAGDLARAARDATAADGIASEVRASLRRIADRGYTGLYEMAAALHRAPATGTAQLRPAKSARVARVADAD